MSLPAVYLINAAITAVIVVGALVWWVASRRRVADATIGQARTECEHMLQQATREIENLRKEAALEAREKAHDLAAEAERQLRQRRQEVSALEQVLAEKTRALTDRLATSDRIEQELRGREKVIAQQEQSASGARRARHRGDRVGCRPAQ
ncbi:MAG: Rnase Y domain-containing protein [Acidobacteria bacterium]|nr:Rnase Y domain-containing protein [Acidobacteriota bacterium]